VSAAWRWQASKSSQRLEEAFDVGRIERCGGAGAGFVDARGERLLALLLFEHTLLDRALRDKLVGQRKRREPTGRLLRKGGVWSGARGS
jgi:hypothetical protein